MQYIYMTGGYKEAYITIIIENGYVDDSLFTGDQKAHMAIYEENLGIRSVLEKLRYI